MPIESKEDGPLEYVRRRLGEIPREERPRLAVNAGISLSTLYNILKSKRDVKYNNVMALKKAIDEADLAVGKP